MRSSTAARDRLGQTCPRRRHECERHTHAHSGSAVAGSPIPSRLRALSVARRSAPPGSGDRRSIPELADVRRTVGAEVVQASARTGRRRLARRRRRASSWTPTASRSFPSGSPEARTTRSPRPGARLSGRRQIRSARRPQDREAAVSPWISATTTPCERLPARIGPPLIVQPMLLGGTELLAGLVQDPVFGPLVAFGPGGVFAELIGDATTDRAAHGCRRRGS